MYFIVLLSFQSLNEEYYTYLEAKIKLIYLQYTICTDLKARIKLIYVQYIIYSNLKARIKLK